MAELIFGALVLAAIWLGVGAHRYRRALWTDGTVMKVRLIGGPMDGRDVLALIGGTYDNCQPLRRGWIRHRYQIRPGGWGVYQGATTEEFGVEQGEQA